MNFPYCCAALRKNAVLTQAVLLCTGEKVFVSLHGSAQDANVRLDKNSLTMESTFLSMATEKTIVISNRSDVIAHFRWTQFATQEEEDQQKLLYVVGGGLGGEIKRTKHAGCFTPSVLPNTCIAGVGLRFSRHSPNWRVTLNFDSPNQRKTHQNHVFAEHLYSVHFVL
jgi:hypothetical protein